MHSLSTFSSLISTFVLTSQNFNPPSVVTQIPSRHQLQLSTAATPSLPLQRGQSVATTLIKIHKSCPS